MLSSMPEEAKLELGCGTTPTDGYLHHDRTLHSEFVDVAHDLNRMPWPWTDGQFEVVQAIDVFEHLTLDPWWRWLDESWRVLEMGGMLVMRLPAWDNPLTYRDPTHRMQCLPFHQERFAYWDPCQPVWEQFGRIYPFASMKQWWHVEYVQRDSGDWRYFLRKVPEDHGRERV